MKETHIDGEPAKVERSASGQRDVPTLNVLQAQWQENLRRGSTSGDNGKGDKGIVGKSEEEQQITHVLETAEPQENLPFYPEKQTEKTVGSLNEEAYKTIQEKYGDLSAAEEKEMGAMQLEEQNKVFEEYITALDSKQLNSPAIEAVYRYVFESIDQSEILMHIAEGGEGKKPIEQIKALRAMKNGDPQKYKAGREYLLTDITGMFHYSGFTALGDIEENPDGYLLMRRIRCRRPSSVAR